MIQSGDSFIAADDVAVMCEQFLSEVPKRTYILPGDLAGFINALNEAKAYLTANFAHSSGDSNFFLFDPSGFCNQPIVAEMSRYMVVAQDVSMKGRKGFSTMNGINFLSFDTLERECVALQQLGPALFITDRSLTDQVAVSIKYDSSRRTWL